MPRKRVQMSRKSNSFKCLSQREQGLEVKIAAEEGKVEESWESHYGDQLTSVWAWGVKGGSKVSYKWRRMVPVPPKETMGNERCVGQGVFS